MDIRWSFARNDGGRETGFHEAGVETFKGNIERYLARELIQNSLDARRDPNKPVLVKFECVDLKREAIPDMDGLRATLQRCSEYWHNDKKARAFFDRGVAAASGKTVRCLRIGDYNTTGVCGSDTDRDNNWYNLIRCAGSSSKGGGEGGSFGIGKNAPFAASHLRAVLYSTFNRDNEYAFQGVATLASHTHPKGSVAQPTGYLGALDGKSLRNKQVVPRQFLRSEYGTDITILGFPDEEWADDLVYSVLDNFWPAIHFGDLDVSVGGRDISRESLRGLLEEFSARENFTAHQFFRAFTEATQEYHEDLPKLKRVSLYLLAGEDLPKRVAMVRKTGMKIFEKQFRSVIPFCGVFICRNEEGNRLLRDMEPPRHDTWDPDHPEKASNKKTETEYLGFIRSCVRRLTPADDSTVLAVPGLHRFLPDDDDSPEESFEAEGETSQESPTRRQLPPKIEASRLAVSRRSMQRDQTQPGSGESETAEGEGDRSTAGGGDTINDGDGGFPGTARPEASARDLRSGTQGGFGSKPAVPVRYRTYGRNLAAGVYALTLESQATDEVNVRVLVWTVGDDQRTHADVAAARLVTGEPVAVTGGVLGPLRLSPKESLCLDVVLRTPMRTAMEVSAHEA